MISLGEPNLQLDADLLDNIVLDGEKIVRWTIIGFRPNMSSIDTVN